MLPGRSHVMEFDMTKLEQKIYAIETDIQAAVNAVSSEECWVMHYGATDIDPGYLTYKICVQSQAEKSKLQQDQKLRHRLRSLPKKHRYPAGAREKVAISFESQEDIDRESSGNAWHHWR